MILECGHEAETKERLRPGDEKWCAECMAWRMLRRGDQLGLRAAVDQEMAAIRNMVDDFPALAEMLREPSPWSDGARLPVVDILALPEERHEARLLAWAELLEPSAT